MSVPITLHVTLVESNGELFVRLSYEDAQDLVGPLVPEEELLAVLMPSDPNAPARASAKKNRRRAVQCENAIAKNLGGIRHKGSGCLSYLKGDVRVKGKFRIESKFTRQKGIRVSLDLLNKIRSECTGSEVPMLDITFVDPQTTSVQEEWVLVPRSIFKKG